MRKVFDCTLGALWRLYVKILFDNIIVFDHDLNFADWVVAIVITALFICAIYVAFMLLQTLLVIAIDSPLPVICCIIGIAVICILPRLALKSYRSSKTKTKATKALSRKAAKTARASKKGYNQ